MNTALLDEVIAQLVQLGIEARLRDGAVDGAVDAYVTLSYRGHRQEFAIQAKNRVTPSSVGALAYPGSEPVLLVAPLVSDETAKRLRDLGIAYADAAGNTHLAWGPILIAVRGRRPRRNLTEGAAHANRAFRPSGLKVVLLLLQEPHLLELPMRDIAHAVGVSTGTVHATIKDLETAGYLIPRKHGFSLVRQRKLLDEWASAYALSLYPKLRLGTFRSEGEHVTAHELAGANALLGGESALEAAGDALRSTRRIIYCTTIPAQIAARHRWRAVQDDDYDVEVRQHFWDRKRDSSPLAPSVLVYGDLLAAADPRLREAADRWRRHDDRLAEIDRS